MCNADSIGDNVDNEIGGANSEVPVGEWVDVPEGMMAVEGCYVDGDGVLRSASDGSCVVWHLKGCAIRGISPREIFYDSETKAPWCGECWKKRKIMLLLGTGATVAQDAVGGVDDTP